MMIAVGVGAGLFPREHLQSDLMTNCLHVGSSVSVLDFLHGGSKDCFCDCNCDTWRSFADYTLCFCDHTLLFLPVLAEHNGLEGTRARWRQLGASTSIPILNFPILNIFTSIPILNIFVCGKLRLRDQARPGVFHWDALTCLLLRRGASRAWILRNLTASILRIALHERAVA